MSENITLQAGDYVFASSVICKPELKQKLLNHICELGFDTEGRFKDSDLHNSGFLLIDYDNCLRINTHEPIRGRKLTPEQVLSATNAKSELDLAKERNAELEGEIEEFRRSLDGKAIITTEQLHEYSKLKEASQ